MRNPALIVLAISLIIFAGCGRELASPMTQDEAMDTLMNLPMQSSSSAPATVDASTPVNYQNLNSLVNDLVASGEIQVSGAGRNAVTASAADLTALTQLLNTLQAQGQNGSKPSLLGIASALLAANSGSTSGTGSKLEAILSLLTQLAPLIATVAPQFAPIITAITTIVPMVISIINLFKKPSAMFNHYVLGNA